MMTHQSCKSVSILQSDVMAIQGQNGQSGNTLTVNQGQNITAPRPNWKANFMCYEGGQKEHLARECSHTGNSTITQSQQTLIISTQQTSCAGPTLLPATNPTLSQTITVKPKLLQKCGRLIWNN